MVELAKAWPILSTSYQQKPSDTTQLRGQSLVCAYITCDIGICIHTHVHGPTSMSYQKKETLAHTPQQAHTPAVLQGCTVCRCMRQGRIKLGLELVFYRDCLLRADIFKAQGKGVAVGHYISQHR